MKQNKEIVFYSILVFLGLIAVGLIINYESSNFFEETKENNSLVDNNQVESIEENIGTNSENKETLEITPNNQIDKSENKEITNDKGSTENNKSTGKQVNNESNKQVITNNTTTNNTSGTNNNNNNANKLEENKAEEIDKSDKVDTSKETVTLSNKDKIVINELNSLEQNTEKLLNDKKDESILDKAKGVFITLVDFCFYDGKIKGITFNELTDAGKEKVLKIVNRIDEKIDLKFPGYKDKISTKTKSAFNKASELIKKGANNIKDFAYEKLGEKDYQAMIEEKDELVKYTKNAWNLVKNFSTSIWEKTTSKIKEWYENFREKNK